MAQKAVFGEMSFTNSIPGLDGTAYSVSLTKGSDNATVDASGNLVGRFYDEVNGIRTYRYHTAVAVNKNNIPLLLAGMMDGNMTAGEGTYSIHATGDNCTVLVVGSTVYITSIANIHDGDASTSEEIDYEAMRSMREAVAHILINCEGKAEATLDYRVQLTHLPNSNVTFLCDNQQIDRAWTEKSGWIGGANGAFPQETIPFRAIHNNQELQITALTPQTVDGARYDEDDCPVKFSDPQLGDTGASVCLTDYTASLDGSKSVKVRFGMTALCNGITYEGFADFILSLSVDNAVYQLKPEATQVNGVWDEDGYEYTPAFLAFPTVLRTSDIDELIELSVPELGGYDLIPQYCINATEWHLYTGGISIADITETVAFRVLKDGIVRDVETIAVLRDGRNGESAFTIDLENEFDTIPTKLSDNGTVVLDYDNGGYYESAVRAFYGTKDVTGECVWTVACPLSDDIENEIARDGWFALRLLSDTAIHDTAITVTARHPQYGTRTAHMLLVAGKPGETVINIQPSVSAVSFKRDNGGLITSLTENVTVDAVWRVDGEVQRQAFNGGMMSILGKTYYLRYSFTSMPTSKTSGTAYPFASLSNGGGSIGGGHVLLPSEREGIGVNANNTALYLALFDAANTLIDRETVPVVVDGKKGADGKGVTNFQTWWAVHTRGDDYEGIAADAWSTLKQTMTSATPYLWTKQTYRIGTEDYSVTPACIGYLPQNGVGSYQLDITNENVSVAIKKDEHGDGYSIVPNGKVGSDEIAHIMTDLYIAGGNNMTPFAGLPVVYCGETPVFGEIDGVFYNGNPDLSIYMVDILPTETDTQGRPTRYSVSILYFGNDNVDFGRRDTFRFRATADIDGGVPLMKDMGVLFMSQGKDGDTPIIHDLVPQFDQVHYNNRGEIDIPRLYGNGADDFVKIRRIVGARNTVHSVGDSLLDGISVNYVLNGTITNNDFSALGLAFNDSEIESLEWQMWWTDGGTRYLIDREDIAVTRDAQGVIPSIVFRRFGAGETVTRPTGGSYTSPYPTTAGWSDGIPDGDVTKPIYMSKRTFTSDGEAPQTDDWSMPQRLGDTSDMDMCFSKTYNPDNPKLPLHHGSQTDAADNGWHDTADVDDVYMAISHMKNGAWGAWQINRIKGEDAVSYMNDTVRLHKRSASSPALPTDSIDYYFFAQEDSGIIEDRLVEHTRGCLNGWTLAIPTGSTQLWVTEAKVTEEWYGDDTNTTVSPDMWSAPAKMGVNGTNGKDGLTWEVGRVDWKTVNVGDSGANTNLGLPSGDQLVHIRCKRGGEYLPISLASGSVANSLTDNKSGVVDGYKGLVRKDSPNNGDSTDLVLTLPSGIVAQTMPSRDIQYGSSASGFTTYTMHFPATSGFIEINLIADNKPYTARINFGVDVSVQIGGVFSDNQKWKADYYDFRNDTGDQIDLLQGSLDIQAGKIEEKVSVNDMEKAGIHLAIVGNEGHADVVADMFNVWNPIGLVKDEDGNIIGGEKALELDADGNLQTRSVKTRLANNGRFDIIGGNLVMFNKRGSAVYSVSVDPLSQYGRITLYSHIDGKDEPTSVIDRFGQKWQSRPHFFDDIVIYRLDNFINEMGYAPEFHFIYDDIFNGISENETPHEDNYRDLLDITSDNYIANFSKDILRSYFSSASTNWPSCSVTLRIFHAAMRANRIYDDGRILLEYLPNPDSLTDLELLEELNGKIVNATYYHSVSKYNIDSTTTGYFIDAQITDASHVDGYYRDPYMQNRGDGFLGVDFSKKVYSRNVYYIKDGIEIDRWTLYSNELYE